MKPYYQKRWFIGITSYATYKFSDKVALKIADLQKKTNHFDSFCRDWFFLELAWVYDFELRTQYTIVGGGEPLKHKWSNINSRMFHLLKVVKDYRLGLWNSTLFWLIEWFMIRVQEAWGSLITNILGCQLVYNWLTIFNNF